MACSKTYCIFKQFNFNTLFKFCLSGLLLSYVRTLSTGDEILPSIGCTCRYSQGRPNFFFCATIIELYPSNEFYFHVDYALKHESVATHDIKLPKNKIIVVLGVGCTRILRGFYELFVGRFYYMIVLFFQNLDHFGPRKSCD